jgi:glyoxylase-like metal-dependent hydrolase (beta-lactamase superfamily II)
MADSSTDLTDAVSAGDPTGFRILEIAPGVHWLPLRGANAYFVYSGKRWALIDAGFPGSGETIVAAARGLCGAAGRPESIVITHGHPDHVGSAVRLAAEWRVPILAPAGELPFIDGTALYPEPLVAWLTRVLPRRVMEALVRNSDLGDAVRPFDPQAGVPGLPDWVCVPTPGHTPGHTAFFRPGDRTLIAGDAVLTMAWPSRLGGGDRAGWLWDLARREPRLSGPPTVVTCDWRDAAASVVTLAGLDPWVLATGHGTPFVGQCAAIALRAFAARVATAPID